MNKKSTKQNKKNHSKLFNYQFTTMTYDVDMFNDIFNDDDDIPNDDMFDENFALLGATLLTLKAEKTKATRANRILYDGNAPE